MIHSEITPDLRQEQEPRRREPRSELDADLSIRKLGSQAAAARLINISSNGFMAECEAEIEPGARVWISLPGIQRINALVLWTRGARFGGEFAAPIDPLLVFQAIGEGMRQSA